MLPPSVHSPLLCLLCPSPPSFFHSILHKLLFLHNFHLQLRNGCWVMRKREKSTITLCLFEFLSSCCHSYSCYIDWCPYEPGYCLTSPPTFAQIRKINKITAATPALPCTNNTLLALQHPAPDFHILHLMVRGENSGFKTYAREEGEDDMVNVNSQVSSSMELPFGEYTLLLLSVWLTSLKRG